MNKHQHHEDLMRSITKEYTDILQNSGQGVYIYLDDSHKVCNKKFATLLGYSSSEEWGEIQESFPDVFVADESQDKLVNTYQKVMENLEGSSANIIWKKKSGGTVETKVILVPVSHAGHLFALHFVS